jgi:hypothetical protein
MAVSVLEAVPPPEVIRVELARSVRETERLRTLLKLSVQTQEDRRFLEELRGRRTQQQES